MGDEQELRNSVEGENEGERASRENSRPEISNINTEGGAYVGGNVTQGAGSRFAGRDLFSVVINIFPQAWQQGIYEFIRENRLFLILSVVLETGLFIIFYRYQGLYRISWWIWIPVALSLLVLIWVELARWKKKSTNESLYIASLVICVGLVGWQVWRIIDPPKFENQEFGIALAELGYGTSSSRNADSIYYTNKVYDHLCATLQKEFEHKTENDPCGELEGPPKSNEVRIMRIGVIADRNTAKNFGGTINADLMIYGNVTPPKPTSGITVQFEILENLDNAVNPDYPFTLPVTSTSLDIITPLRDLGEMAPGEIEEKVAPQTTTMSSFLLGLIAFLDRDYPLAIQRFELAISTIKDNPSLEISNKGLSLIYFYLGQSNLLIGNVDRGQELLLMAQELNPDEPAIPLSLAFGYRSLNQADKRDEYLDEAFDLLERWLSKNQGDTTAMYDKGIAIFLRRQIEDGLQYRANEDEVLLYKDILKHDPNFYIAYINLARAYRTRQEYTEAEDVLNQAIQLAEEMGTNSTSAYLDLAAVRAESGQSEAANAAYQEAIKRSNNKAIVYLQYAQFLGRNQENDAALLAYQNSFEAANDNDKGLIASEYARFLRKLGLLTKALELYQVAVYAKPKDPLVRTYLAETYYDRGDINQAFREFDQAMRLNVDNGYYVYSSYCRALYLEGDFERASELCQRSLEILPDSEYELSLLASIYEKQGECQQAVDVYTRILNLDERISTQASQIARDSLARLQPCAPTP